MLPEDEAGMDTFALDTQDEVVEKPVEYSGPEEDEETESDSDSDFDKSELDAAAQLLLSVSPRIPPMRPRSLSHLEPLQSLADAAFGQPKTSDVEKLRGCLQGISRNAGMGSLLAFNSKGKGKKKKNSSSSKGTKIKLNLSSRSNSTESESGLSKRGRKRKKENIFSSSEAATKRKRPHGTVVPSLIKNTKFEKNYNLEGRIGIYTPEQRKKLLEKFRKKRRKRVWFKKVRYGCRKNLADRRLRIKGRFVRADSKEYKEYFAKLAREAKEKGNVDSNNGPTAGHKDSMAVSGLSLQVNSAKEKNLANSGTAQKVSNLVDVYPKMTPTAFSILANSNGRPRAASTLT